ncbi:c-type cytochrome [Gilvibacter sediminis]|uniref:c-type cytochrome n=1 Tax=Gilvibacter sediminis TaxID=379071 RepID=UPI0023504F83|nr:c-type cytochrome [Gilvibacter sediminis]MDC7998310.1 c-type cytochrome [Gilvibacter sediminis]
MIGLGTGIDKTTLMVDDIDEAIAIFRDTLGFSIRGEASPGSFPGAIQKGISLGDLSSFQLLSKKDSVVLDSTIPFLRKQELNGSGFFALSSSAVDSVYRDLSVLGMKLDTVKAYRGSSEPVEGWSWETGDVSNKSLDFNADSPPAFLPRFEQQLGSEYNEVQDDWKTYYVYTRMFNKHANGVVGTSAVKIAVKDLDSISKYYDTMGFEPLFRNDSIVKYSVFRHQELHLVTAAQDSSAKDYLDERNDGLYAVEFDVENLDSTYTFFKKELPESALRKTGDRLIVGASYAFGLQLEFVQEPDYQAEMAKKLTPKDSLDPLAVEHASGLYTKYCALCHGADREGYAADNAPSLKSESLLGSSKNNNFMRYTIQFGRANTAMAGYINSQGGPLEYIEVELLLEYLYQAAGVDKPIELSREPIAGDIAQGAELYAKNCAVCHGGKGEGVSAPALANPMLLATATDHFLRYAIAEGRDGTPMLAFKDSLSETNIDDITAFLRSRAAGWDVPQRLDSIVVPKPEAYVLNPDSIAPEFTLRDDKFVSAEQVNEALLAGKRMIILDARSEVAWRQMHIPGAIPVPYYSEPDEFIEDIPNDGTQIVIYCACPHAASKRVLNTLRRYNYKNTAIIDEGVLVWAQMGFPVRSGS